MLEFPRAYRTDRGGTILEVFAAKISSYDLLLLVGIFPATNAVHSDFVVTTGTLSHSRHYL